jgi:hypothetical protein
VDETSIPAWSRRERTQILRGWEFELMVVCFCGLCRWRDFVVAYLLATPDFVLVFSDLSIRIVSIGETHISLLILYSSLLGALISSVKR